MVKFELARERKGKRSSKKSFSRKGPRSSNRSFEDRPKKDFKRKGRDRGDVEMTKVVCSSCQSECEVPFKPTSTKPVYCNACFAKKGGKSYDKGYDKKGYDKPSNGDLDIINEKLNKIMKALKIE
ncbi:CxxC-x17-CxxC domain-containing protein [Nanoarchaeota archaeon]